uniref:Putative nuclease HARBI1 n=1 Tax=Pygocentrus nattereri TaxID=42514 RepID=A0AAR2JGW4_PYGNA
MAFLALLEDLASRQIRRQRIFRDHEDFFANDDDWLMSRFRFPRAILLTLCAELGPDLERPTLRNRAIPVHLQVLTTLGFLATGCFQRELADRSGISQPSLSSMMSGVLSGIIKLTGRYIRFPYTLSEQADIKVQFAAVAGFPNVIGAIDCTHIAIRAPSQNEAAFINRKQIHSINVQVICDATMTLTNVVARWPGSTHDSFILRNSSVGTRLENGAVRDGWLLGDSGYPLKRWLLTPFPNPQSTEERRYNDVHTLTRSVVERTIGLLKGRWRCLDASGGRLLYNPEKVCRIVRACAVLHNMAQQNGLPLIMTDQQANDPEPDPHVYPPDARNIQAVRLREDVMRRL